MIRKLRDLFAAKKPAKQIKYRNCVTGKYCSKAYAQANPATTVAERDR